MAKKEWREYRYVPLEEQESIDEILQRNLKAMREGKLGPKPRRPADPNFGTSRGLRGKPRVWQERG